MSDSAWLPDLLNAANYPDVAALEQAAWEIFQKDFETPVPFRSEEIVLNTGNHPANPKRGYSYWHSVTEGHPEKHRKSPDLERLVRIPWLRPVIEHEKDREAAIKVWSNSRKGSNRICIWFHKVNYLIVLKPLRTNYLLKTTYCPQSDRCKQLHREYARWKKNGARL